MTTSIADLIEALNFSDWTHLSSEPARRGEKWSVYEGTDQIRHTRSPFSLLHVESGCGDDDLLRLVDRELDVLREHVERRLEIVVSDARLRDAAASRIKLRGLGDRVPVLAPRDYLRNLVRSRADKYRERLQQQEPRDYVAPHLLRDKHRTLNTAIQLALAPDPNAKGSEGHLIVLLAEPGQGKTYYSKYAACTLRQQTAVYVDSTQWQPLKDAESIYKTILNSFRHYDCAVELADGQEQRFVEIMLDAGIMRVIFDGLDEYVLWSRGAIRAVDVVDELARLAKVTRSSVVVTSRTSFWQAEIGDDVTDASGKPIDNVLVYEIAPFDENQAKNYFEKKLDAEPDRANAIALFRRLQSTVTPEFLGRGFLLRLIADVARGNASAPPSASKTGIVRWLAGGLCEREVVRQRLDLNGARQMQVFSLILDLTNGGRTFSREDLQVALSEVRDDDGSVIPSERFVEVLREHPLVQQVTSDSWVFADDQLRMSIVSELVVSLIDEGDALALLARRILSGPIQPEELAFVLADALADPRVASDAGHISSEAAVGALMSTLLFGTPRREQNLRRCATELASLWVDQETRTGRDRRERTDRLRSLFGGRDLAELVFAGTIARYDFRATTFRNCTFIDVHWRSCDFDGSTRFVNCSARGGSQETSHSMGLADWSGSTELDSLAREFLARLRASAGHVLYSMEMLRADIIAVLRKFVGPRGVKSIRRSNLRKGVIGDSPHVDLIVTEFERQILSSHRISSVSEDGLAIRDAVLDDALFFSINGVLIGSLDALTQSIARKLRLA